ncbi:MAG: ATP-binding cassette domain-containing protein [Streptosporangiales bacterium]|nr:ATP-binding cassette domain-containing protein [Streptosporangiales bacterium]
MGDSVKDEVTAGGVERRSDSAGSAGAGGQVPLLQVSDLHVEFRTREQTVRANNGVFYHVNSGEALAILGESGSGKSVSAQAVMGIIDMPPGHIPAGEIKFNGTDLLKLTEEQRRKVRGNDIAMIFQDALSALNPVMTVGDQIGEMFRVHRGVSKSEARKRSIELMDRVRIPAAKSRVDDYPHQFSGGMRQRVMIAMALSLEPDVLIADEPTTALDVTVQAQIMKLLSDLRTETNMGLILITHDLGVVADVADRIVVMYAGKIVETAEVYELYGRPSHPYTEGLLNSIPRLDQKGEELTPIPGAPPNLASVPPGCSFHPRCHRARDICSQDVPPLYEVGANRYSACHFWEEVIADAER